MTEAQAFEKIGRLQCALEQEMATRQRICSVFAEVLSGQCDPSRVMVNLTENNVIWAAPGETVPMPSTINGVPVCVVAAPKVMVSVDMVELTGKPVTVVGQFAIQPRAVQETPPV